MRLKQVIFALFQVQKNEDIQSLQSCSKKNCVVKLRTVILARIQKDKTEAKEYWSREALVNVIINKTAIFFFKSSGTETKIC